MAALQRCGRVTAMVGDGANDAAAIRMADVGIGVSGRGSSAARGAADIVLTDDDLGVLLDALVEGRSMWSGVRDAVTILVGGNVGEVLFTIIGTAFGSGRAPVGTRQLLLVNLLTDMFPALAVAVTSQYDEPDDDEFETDEEAEEARRAHQREVLTGPTPSLDAPLMRQIVNRGVVTAAGATAAWAIGRWTPGTERRTSTMGLTALVTTQLAQTLLTRSHSPLVVATALGSAGVLGRHHPNPGHQPVFRLHTAGAGGLDGRVGCHGRSHRDLRAGAEVAEQDDRDGRARGRGRRRGRGVSPTASPSVNSSRKMTCFSQWFHARGRGLRPRRLSGGQLLAQHLAGGIAWNAVDDVDVSGLLEARNLALQVLSYRLLVDVALRDRSTMNAASRRPNCSSGTPTTAFRRCRRVRRARFPARADRRSRRPRRSCRLRGQRCTAGPSCRGSPCRRCW